MQPSSGVTFRVALESEVAFWCVYHEYTLLQLASAACNFAHVNASLEEHVPKYWQLNKIAPFVMVHYLSLPYLLKILANILYFTAARGTTGADQ